MSGPRGASKPYIKSTNAKPYVSSFARMPPQLERSTFSPWRTNTDSVPSMIACAVASVALKASGPRPEALGPPPAHAIIADTRSSTIGAVTAATPAARHAGPVSTALQAGLWHDAHHPEAVDPASRWDRKTRARLHRPGARRPASWWRSCQPTMQRAVCKQVSTPSAALILLRQATHTAPPPSPSPPSMGSSMAGG